MALLVEKFFFSVGGQIHVGHVRPELAVNPIEADKDNALVAVLFLTDIEQVLFYSNVFAGVHEKAVGLPAAVRTFCNVPNKNVGGKAGNIFEAKS